MARMDLRRNAGYSYSLTEDDLITHIKSAKSIDRRSYVQTIERWRGLVDESGLLIVFYDELVESPKAFMGKVLRFLDVDPEKYDWSDSILETRVHSGSSDNINVRVRRAAYQLYRDEILMLDRLLNSEYTARWRREVENLD